VTAYLACASGIVEHHEIDSLDALGIDGDRRSCEPALFCRSPSEAEGEVEESKPSTTGVEQSPVLA